MKDFRNIIQSESKDIDRLHKQIHVTYEAKEKDIEAWKEACAAFHTHVSGIDSLIDRVYKASMLKNELIEFSITFLEMNPMFFRSGYIKEEMLRKLKRSALSEKQKERLRAVLIDAVNHRGTREFRRYCRLLPKVYSPEIIALLKNTYEFSKGSQKSRAAIMLGYADGSNT